MRGRVGEKDVTVLDRESEKMCIPYLLKKEFFGKAELKEVEQKMGYKVKEIFVLDTLG